MINRGESPIIGRPAPDVTAVEIDGRIALFTPSSGQVAVLNESASLVWSLCDGRRTEAGLVTEVVALTGAPVAEVGRDIATILHRLHSLGALTPP